MAAIRRDSFEPSPPASRDSAASPVSVSVSTVVVRSGTRRRRAVAFCRPIDVASSEMSAYCEAGSAGPGPTATMASAMPTSTILHAGGDRQEATAVLGGARRKASTGERAQQEGADRGERGEDRKARRARDREAQEHHVARHVGDEYLAQLEVAERVDESGYRREHQEQQRERAVALIRGDAGEVERASDEGDGRLRA